MTKLVQKLYPVIDKLRGLNDKFGTRRHEVKLVKYELSDPDNHDTREICDGFPILLEPQPRIDGLSTSLKVAQGGVFNQSDLIVTEISPQLTEEDIKPELEKNEQFYWLVDEQHYVVKAHEPRLTDWKVHLQRVREK